MPRALRRRVLASMEVGRLHLLNSSQHLDPRPSFDTQDLPATSVVAAVAVAVFCEGRVKVGGASLGSVGIAFGARVGTSGTAECLDSNAIIRDGISNSVYWYALSCHATLQSP